MRRAVEKVNDGPEGPSWASVTAASKLSGRSGQAILDGVMQGRVRKIKLGGTMLVNLDDCDALGGDQG
jgi:hypothetical protein